MGVTNRIHSTRPRSRLYSDIPRSDAPVIYTGAFPILTAGPGRRSIYNIFSSPSRRGQIKILKYGVSFPSPLISWLRSGNLPAPSLNRALSSQFSWLRSANHVKFTEGMMFTDYHVLVKKKCLQISQKRRLLLRACVEKTVGGVEIQSEKCNMKESRRCNVSVSINHH